MRSDAAAELPRFSPIGGGWEQRGDRAQPVAANGGPSNESCARFSRAVCHTAGTPGMYHNLVKRIERIRLYPTASQTKALHFMLDVTRELYNALLEERRDAWRRRRVAINAKEQYVEITALRSKEDRLDGRLAAVYRETEDSVLHRLELAFQAFFRRMRRGETPGRTVERLQRTVARRTKGGKNRGKAVVQLARAHERLANARRDALYKIARRLIADADVIALEALNLRAMTRSAKGTVEQPGRNVAAEARLNRVLLDASFGLRAADDRGESGRSCAHGRRECTPISTQRW